MELSNLVKNNTQKIKYNEKLIKKNRNIATGVITSDQPFPNKLQNVTESVIPLNIFQTWHTKLLPKYMAETVLKIKKMNPTFNHYLFDDSDCESFIARHFKLDVLNTFRRLIPGAYKADLWRYCVLFIKGGIYLDIKYKPINNFKFINLTESEHFCFDTDDSNIYNAIMVCKPKNKICYKAIRRIVENVNNKYYGNDCLDPTGPGLLKRCIGNDKMDIAYIDLNHKLLSPNNNNTRVIKYNKYYIFKQYRQYMSDYETNTKTMHYSNLWNAKKIYL
jgi:mannosyltransferase OCH1-like enzyme